MLSGSISESTGANGEEVCGGRTCGTHHGAREANTEALLSIFPLPEAVVGRDCFFLLPI